MNHDVQDILDARVAAFKDHYMDDQAVIDLKKALLSETRATRVLHRLDKDRNVLHLTVEVGSDTYRTEIALEKRVPRLNDEVTLPHVSFSNDLPEDQKQAIHEQREKELSKQQDDDQKAQDQARQEAQKQSEQTSRKKSEQ